MNGRGWLKVVLGLIIGSGLLALIAWRIDWSRVLETLASSRPVLLIPIALLLSLHYLLKGLRWRVLLSSRAEVSHVLAMRVTLVGFLMNNVIPLRLGELSRPYLLSANRPEIPFAFGLATVFADKLFDLVLTLLCLLAASLALVLPETAGAGVIALGATCATILALGLVAAWWRRRRAEERPGVDVPPIAPEDAGRLGRLMRAALQHFSDGLAAIASWKRALVALGYTVLSFALLAGAMMLSMAMVNLEASPMTALFVIGMVGIALVIPAPPTHIGSYHFFAAQALLLAGVAEDEVAFAFAVIAHLSQVVVVSALGALSLIGLGWRWPGKPPD